MTACENRETKGEVIYSTRRVGRVEKQGDDEERRRMEDDSIHMCIAFSAHGITAAAAVW
jgi:hypothetical protein